jgi:2-oxo-4-hydroxy-4-carboxy-5-ureidoimidazoline decarboxylase
MISSEQKQEIAKLNNIYRARYGFTFVVCARENKADSILTGLATRVQNTEREEVEIGLGEVAKIAKLRATDLISTRSKL